MTEEAFVPKTPSPRRLGLGHRLRLGLVSLASSLVMLAVGLPVVLPVGTAQAAGDPVRVLIVGDSITAGVHGDYTWRYRLAKEFARQGVPVNFVGSHTWPYVASGFSSATYADPHFDHDHFASGGALLKSQAGEIEHEVATQQADVVVLASGLNDLVHGGTNAVPDALASLSSFVDHVRAANPSAEVVVSPVLTIDRDIPGLNTKIIDYDNRAATLVKQLSTSSSRVVMAPTRNNWTSARSRGYVQDGIHLTPKGDFFVAYRIASALESLGVLRQRPPAVPSSATWVRNLKPTLRLSGNQMVVTWDSQALTAARIWVRRRWGGWHPVTTSRTSYVRTLTPGATYDVKVQGIRRTMTSTTSADSAIKAAPLRPVARVAVKSRKVVWSRVFGATSYVVRYQRRGSTAWSVRTVTRNSLRVRAALVEVSARNPFSTATPTIGRRRR